MSDKDYTWLIEGLVGLRHRDLYLHNAEFHAQIDALNQMLPPMVDGLAKRAEEIGDWQETEIKRINKGAAPRRADGLSATLSANLSRWASASEAAFAKAEESWEP